MNQNQSITTAENNSNGVETQASVKEAKQWTYKQLSDHLNHTQSRLNSPELDGCDTEIERLIKFRKRLLEIFELKNDLFFEKKERLRLKRISDWHLTFGN
jgi:hypothetical protein